MEDAGDRVGEGERQQRMAGELPWTPPISSERLWFWAIGEAISNRPKKGSERPLVIVAAMPPERHGDHQR